MKMRGKVSPTMFSKIIKIFCKRGNGFDESVDFDWAVKKMSLKKKKHVVFMS